MLGRPRDNAVSFEVRTTHWSAKVSSDKVATYFAAGWSSLVARRAHNPKVAGSNPAPATIDHDQLAPGSSRGPVERSEILSFGRRGRRIFTEKTAGVASPSTLEPWKPWRSSTKAEGIARAGSTNLTNRCRRIEWTCPSNSAQSTIPFMAKRVRSEQKARNLHHKGTFRLWFHGRRPFELLVHSRSVRTFGRIQRSDLLHVFSRVQSASLPMD